MDAQNLLRSMLDNPKDFPDDRMIDFGNGQVYSMKALREADAGDRTRINQEWSKIKKAQDDLAAANQNVSQLYSQAQDLLAQAQSKGANINKLAGAAIDDPLSIYEQDEALAPLAKTLRKLESALSEQQKSFTSALQQANLGRVYDRWERQYDAHADVWKDEQGNPMDINAAIKWANDNGHKDANGVVDLRKAAQARINSKSADERAKSEYERGRAEGEKAAKAAMVPPPGGGARTVRQRSSEKDHKDILSNPRKSWDTIFDKASQDPDIAAGVRIQ